MIANVVKVERMQLGNKGGIIENWGIDHAN
jgi:hypothetical protein